MREKIKIVRTQKSLRAQITAWRLNGETIAFVPTMGALHSGHMSLVNLANKKADRTVASIFVNPTQFAPDEDFDAYPRTEKNDVDQLQAEGCDLVYIPRKGSMYNAHHATHIKVGGVAEGLETDHRPSFFEGVALVVTKLLNRVAPDIAIFGEKDYQQLATIRRLVEDLDMPIKILGAKIARDKYGLALSSRNKYFDSEGLDIARQLNVIMRDCANALKGGADINRTTKICARDLLDAGFSEVDYVSVADTNSLEILQGRISQGRISQVRVSKDNSVQGKARLLIAAHCAGVRLIDNCAI